MIEAVLVFGLIVFAGLAFIFIKLPARISLRLLGYPIVLDLVVTVLTLWIHWGTMTGLMAAAVAGFTCSIFTTGARWLVGYIDRGRYFPGVIALEVQL